MSDRTILGVADASRAAFMLNFAECIRGGVARDRYRSVLFVLVCKGKGNKIAKCRRRKRRYRETDC